MIILVLFIDLLINYLFYWPSLFFMGILILYRPKKNWLMYFLCGIILDYIYLSKLPIYTFILLLLYSLIPLKFYRKKKDFFKLLLINTTLFMFINYLVTNIPKINLWAFIISFFPTLVITMLGFIIGYRSLIKRI